MSERDVEEECVERFRATPGIMLACFSPQNVDRLVTIYRAAKRSGRRLALDLYGAEVARATGRHQTIPQASRHRKHGRKRWQISVIARCPEMRNSTHPTISGAQMSRLTCCVVSPARKESIRLIPNANVPGTALCRV